MHEKEDFLRAGCLRVTESMTRSMGSGGQGGSGDGSPGVVSLGFCSSHAESSATARVRRSTGVGRCRCDVLVEANGALACWSLTASSLFEVGSPPSANLTEGTPSSGAARRQATSTSNPATTAPSARTGGTPLRLPKPIARILCIKQRRPSVYAPYNDSRDNNAQAAKVLPLDSRLPTPRQKFRQCPSTIFAALHVDEERGGDPWNVGAMMGHTTSAMVEREYDGRTPELLSVSRPSSTRGFRRRSSRRTARKKKRCARPARRPALTHLQQTRPPVTQIPRTPWTCETTRNRGFPRRSGTPGKIRTYDIRLRRPTLYPAELRAQNGDA